MTSKVLLTAATAATLSLAGCALGPRPNAAAPATYVNPVLDGDFPDPTVIRAADGYYYGFATQGAGSGTFRNLQVARSVDLFSWQSIADALPVKPVWAAKTQDFWAPHVSWAGGLYYLYYSAKPDAALTDDKAGLCLGVATSARPEGPYVDKGRPLLCGPGFVNIDPMQFDDPATGKPLLYWGSGFQPIKVQELAPDRLSFTQGSAPHDLVATLKSNDPNEYQQLVEGAWVIHQAGYYYLFYSGNNCCGKDAHYAVMVARSRNAFGPFEVRPTPLKVMLQANGKWNAPGHNSIIRDSRGDDWIVYHAVDRANPGEVVNTRRVMLIDRLVWVGGWPTVAGGSPSVGPRPAPR